MPCWVFNTALQSKRGNMEKIGGVVIGTRERG